MLKSKTRPEHDRIARERKLEDLFKAHADAVLGFLRHRTDHETAQEVLTETFVIAWRKLDEVPEEPRGWLYAVARRVLANHVRSKGRTAALVDRLANERPVVATETDLDEALHRSDVLSALAGLPERDREVLLLAGWYELTGPQAAQALGCSQGAYAVRLHRARGRLRTALARSTPEQIKTTPHPAWEGPR